MVDCICNECGGNFKRVKSEIKSDVVYCGRECYLIQLHKRNSKTRAPKIECSCFSCGKIVHRWPSQIKNKQHIFCSKKCNTDSTTVLRSGENHPRWNDKLTESDRDTARKYPEYLTWRESVYSRDLYTCQCCGDNKGGNLIAHHLYNYSEHKDIKTVLDNGITLCKECHKQFHDDYGYTKNNDLQLEEFIGSFHANPEPSVAGM